jgi:hypothetical protein
MVASHGSASCPSRGHDSPGERLSDGDQNLAPFSSRSVSIKKVTSAWAA